MAGIGWFGDYPLVNCGYDYPPVWRDKDDEDKGDEHESIQLQRHEEFLPGGG